MIKNWTIYATSIWSIQNLLLVGSLEFAKNEIGTNIIQVISELLAFKKRYHQQYTTSEKICLETQNSNGFVNMILEPLNDEKIVINFFSALIYAISPRENLKLLTHFPRGSLIPPSELTPSYKSDCATDILRPTPRTTSSVHFSGRR